MASKGVRNNNGGPQVQLNMRRPLVIGSKWRARNDVTLFHGDCIDLLAQVPEDSVRLIVTSPPYNIGKQYETKSSLYEYLSNQREVIHACIEKLQPGGSICWQVGNHVHKGEVFPLDILLYKYFTEKGLKLRNRIVWHFGHGLHTSKRFSGRHETIVWFTKNDSKGEYLFNLDPVRIPQKYPGKKHYKGPRKGQPSAHPLGKNPGDVWIIPNVKHNHVEKTLHPCQFPIELVERLVLALTQPGDLVLDPYMGVGSALAAAVMHNRRAAGSEVIGEYVGVAKGRLLQAAEGLLPTRPRTRPIYVPPVDSPLTRSPWEETAKTQRDLLSQSNDGSDPPS
jgi:adenine-specific DNA-methyltransferase